MSLWRVLLKQIAAAEPVIHGSDLYDGTDPQRTWCALDWLQAHRLVRAVGPRCNRWYRATVLGEHIVKGIVPIERVGRSGYHLRFPSGQIKRLARHVQPQPSFEVA